MIYLKYDSSQKSDYPSLHSATRTLLAELLGIIFGIDFSNVSVKTAKGGKPYIERENFDFSGSHTKNAVVVAVAGEGGVKKDLICIDKSVKKVGVDIEWTGRKIKKENMLAIMQKIYTEREREYVNFGTRGDKNRFLEIWTKKESIVKAGGEGLSAIRRADTFGFRGELIETKYVNIGKETYILSIVGSN